MTPNIGYTFPASGTGVEHNWGYHHSSVATNSF